MSRLHNYLRSHRKRLALSQEDVAFLLGKGGGAKICRYERFVREPNLETALAFEIIFQKPIKELFAGLHRKIEQKVAKKAKVLSNKKSSPKETLQTARKRQALNQIASLDQS